MNNVKTYDEWKQSGYHVRKGQKACGYNADGDAIFHTSQVSETTHYGYSSNNDPNNERGHEFDELMGFDAYTSPGSPF